MESCCFFSQSPLDRAIRFTGQMEAPPAHRNAPSEHSGVPHGLFMISHHRPCGRWCFARLIRQAETLELQLHSQPPSKRTALSPPKRSCFRFASLTLRLRTEPALRAAPVFRSAFFSKRPCYGLFSKTLDLQVRFAHPPVGGGSFAPPCTPLSCPRRTRTDGQVESALDWVGRETARAAGGGAMRPRSGRRHGEAGRAVCLCGVRKGRMGGPEGVRGSRSAPGLPRRGSGGANRPPVKPTHRPRTEKVPFSVRGPAIICVRNNH